MSIRLSCNSVWIMAKSSSPNCRDRGTRNEGHIG
jgi:hypothetical protein